MCFKLRVALFRVSNMHHLTSPKQACFWMCSTAWRYISVCILLPMYLWDVRSWRSAWQLYPASTFAMASFPNITTTTTTTTIRFMLILPARSIVKQHETSGFFSLRQVGWYCNLFFLGGVGWHGGFVRILWAWISAQEHIRDPPLRGGWYEESPLRVFVYCFLLTMFFFSDCFLYLHTFVVDTLHAFVLDTWARNQAFCKNPPGFLLNHDHYGLFRKHQQIFGEHLRIWEPCTQEKRRWTVTSGNPKLLSKTGIQLAYLHLERWNAMARGSHGSHGIGHGWGSGYWGETSLRVTWRIPKGSKKVTKFAAGVFKQDLFFVTTRCLGELFSQLISR